MRFFFASSSHGNENIYLHKQQNWIQLFIRGKREDWAHLCCKAKDRSPWSQVLPSEFASPSQQKQFFHMELGKTELINIGVAPSDLVSHFCLLHFSITGKATWCILNLKRKIVRNLHNEYKWQYTDRTKRVNHVAQKKKKKKKGMPLQTTFQGSSVSFEGITFCAVENCF